MLPPNSEVQAASWVAASPTAAMRRCPGQTARGPALGEHAEAHGKPPEREARGE